MTRRLTPQTTLDNLKKEAKRWLKLLRSGDADARARFIAAWPEAPSDPVLRDLQYAIARQYEFENWKALKEAIEKQPRPEPRAHVDDPVARFLEFACPDHHVRGRRAHRMARHAAMRLLEQHPEIARADFYTAVVCGDLQQADRLLRARPELANAKRPASGPARSGGGGNYDFLDDLGGKDWTPLLFLCFTRIDLPGANENAMEMARLLLDHGADPNAYYMAGNSRYTPLTGVIGEGEEDRPPHPHRDELARLLLERGANPYDQQVNYNIHFRGNVLWYVKLMYEFSVKAGRAADWQDPEWHMLDAGGYGSGARWYLWIAVQHNDLELAKWCLDHGANPNSGPPRAQSLPQASLYEQAVRAGHHQIAELLASHGAERVPVALSDEDRFLAACLKLDRDEARRMLAAHPEYLQSPKAIFAAARQDRADVVEFLLELGTSVEVEDDKKQRPLHVAAWANGLKVAKLLIERGAEIDARESNDSNTPLDFAVWADYQPMIDLLVPYSRDVWNLVPLGAVEPLREAIATEPLLAKVSSQTTPLFWLPDNEGKAVEIVRLLLENGADPKFRNQKNGTVAAEVARRRGLHRAAALLEAAAGGTNESDSERKTVSASFDQLARDMVTVYAADDAESMARINQHYSASYAPADIRALVWRLMYKVRQAKADPAAFQLPEAQEFIARMAGFPNWTAFTEAATSNQPAPGLSYAIDEKQDRIALRRIPGSEDWDAIIGVMKEHRIPALEARMMTDEALRRISQLDFVTSLSLGGSRRISDEGMQYLADMPQLVHLNLSEHPGGKLTDRGLQVLRHLPNLRTFEMAWQKGITDAGVANLHFCENLETVDLTGTPTGDGVIEALRGKKKLRHFNSGRFVTDAGLRMLCDFPMFATPQEGKVDYHLMVGADDEPTSLLVDGPFTDEGFASLRQLDGVRALTLFWHVNNVTPGGLSVLADFKNVRQFRCDGELSNDTAMAHYARMPELRFLSAQGNAATDDGFAALGRSATLEYFWGRECPKLTGRGFAALSKMPRLRGLGVSCKQLDDAALALLPAFPRLRELMPMDVPDDGFRHVGRCEKLEKLWCMYCRDTTDAATDHIAGLKLKAYYAGLTQITDRSLEILGQMTSLEKIELYETKNVTDAGIVQLAKLPRLREVSFSGLPQVTIAATKIFPATVKVKYEV